MEPRQSTEGTSVGVRRVSNPFRRRRSPRPIQNEIQPASSTDTESRSPPRTYSQPETTIPDLIERLRYQDEDSLHSALSQIISLTKNPNEGVVNEFVANGALPVLMQLLIKESFDIQTRIRVAAAICNLSHARHAQRSFCSCDAVSLLVDSVIGEHQALTGAAALMFRSMLISDTLVRSMVATDAPMILLRGLMLCPSVEISDTIVDVLIQMTAIKEIKDYLVSNRVVESCIYFLHVLARSHYLTSIRRIEQFYANSEDSGPPAFVQRSMRKALIWALMHPEGSDPRPSTSLEMTSPEVLFFVAQREGKNWEERLKDCEVIGTDGIETDFTERECTRATLFMELLTCLVDDSAVGCSHLASTQGSLEVLAYWIRKGSSLMKQGGLLTTCFLLRNGHRAFVTLKDVVEAVMSVLGEPEHSNSGVTFTKYKCVAAEAVNDLSVFGGDNVRNAICAAGILRPLLSLLELDSYQLQHLTLRALHNVCTHPIALGQIVDCGAIPFLCHFFNNGLKEAQRHAGNNCIRSISKVARGCLSRKRVATVSMTQAEIEHTQRQEEDYSRIRRLEYCAALLRCIAAVQSEEWLHDFNRSRIVPITLDAFSQNYSVVLRRQALGILASIVTLRDSNVSTSICLEGGCDLLLTHKIHAEKSGDAESPFWRAWLNFVLYYLAQSSKTRRFVENAMRQQYGEGMDLRGTLILESLKPEQNDLQLEWIASIT